MITLIALHGFMYAWTFVLAYYYFGILSIFATCLIHREYWNDKDIQDMHNCILDITLTDIRNYLSALWRGIKASIRIITRSVTRLVMGIVKWAKQISFYDKQPSDYEVAKNEALIASPFKENELKWPKKNYLPIDTFFRKGDKIKNRHTGQVADIKAISTYEDGVSRWFIMEFEDGDKWNSEFWHHWERIS